MNTKKKKDVDYDDVFDEFIGEYNNDSNSLYKEGWQLKDAYDKGSKDFKEGVDRAFRALCGYSFKTLVERVETGTTEYPSSVR